MAEFTNLTGVLDRKVKELSGGMVRRQSLALAIIWYFHFKLVNIKLFLLKNIK